MMADPAVTSLTENTWTKVATAVASGYVHILRTVGTDGTLLRYLQTYRATGGTAPTTLTEAVPLMAVSNPIQSSFDIDVYLIVLGGDGSVRVDV